MAGGVGGKFVAGVLEGAPKQLVVPLAVLGDDLADRVLRVFELRGGVEEGAAAEVGLANLGGDVVADGADEVAPLQRFGLLRGARGNLVVRTAQVGNDEIGLAGEVPVEGRERHLPLLGESLDPHAVDALGIEQLRRGGQQTLACCRALPGGRRLGGGHVRTKHRRESDRS